MKKAIKFFTIILFLICTISMSTVIYAKISLPDRFVVAQGETLKINFPLSITTSNAEGSFPAEVYSAAGNSYKLNLKFGALNLKTVQVDVVQRKSVIPGGQPFGIKMFTKGVIIVGLSDINEDGTRINPAKVAGLKAGDIILEMDGKEITNNKQVGEIVGGSKGKAIKIKYIRNDKSYTTDLKPIKSDVDGMYRAGVWVRDSSAGIGTVTYFDTATGLFAGLGHAICDIDTGSIMPLNRGEVVDVDITGVSKGAVGSPGELLGSFINTRIMGGLYANSETGVYGTMSTDTIKKVSKRNYFPLAMRYEVKPGPAYIYCTLGGNTPEKFNIMIEKVNLSDQSPTKNMVIKVTDSKLLDKTGGIVQGMSGSPIIQNNMLVGAVTHVFVNDPQRGFGIFAENIYEGANFVYNKAHSVA